MPGKPKTLVDVGRFSFVTPQVDVGRAEFVRPSVDVGSVEFAPKKKKKLSPLALAERELSRAKARGESDLHISVLQRMVDKRKQSL